MRKLIATVLIVPMKLTGFRFSKDYRWGTNQYYKTVYALVDTVWANRKAGL